MKTIAIIDDDVYIGDMLAEVLEREGYGVLRAYSGTEALFLLSSKTPDLILLDLMLPGLSGEEILPKIKGIPVIVVSAKLDVDHKVEILMNGASDYITKPFNVKELLARISVALRSSERCSSVLRCGELELDVSSCRVTLCGNEVKLTRTEFAILKYLMQNEGAVVSKSRLLESISLDTPDCTESSLKIHISNLRKKLRYEKETEYIEAVWGIGFKLENK